uniref:NADH-ubiquinone oxidoreductase chain 2 n=1 Tax=Mastigoproctus giganteus TaxID=58767 RepID=B1Q0F1_MASGI|nr:NADH dehydrogenase subunit 2 [Mastigoproctus giganteus]
MFLNYFLFLFMLLFSIIIAISSTSWFILWLALEINTLSFCGMIFSWKSKNSSESSMKYFLAQSFSSAIFIFSAMWNFSNFFQINSTLNTLFINLMLMMLVFKLGMIPFHIWFTTLLPKLSWENSFMILSLQKIIPLWAINSISDKTILILCVIFSAILSPILGFGILIIKSMLAYSSISHLAWMTASMMYNSNIWLTYLIIYSFTTLAFLYPAYFMKMTQLNQSSFQNLTLFMKFSILFSLLSMGGLPPFLGFFPKWLIINILWNSHFITLILIVSSLINLFFYTRVSYASIFISSNPNKTMFLSSSISSLFLLISTLMSPFIFLFV